MISSAPESASNSCSSLDASAVSQEDDSNVESNKKTFEDPVTKAVVDNIMGRLPSKKSRVTLHCDICNLEFYSQITLDMHLKGAKHAKRIKSGEIIEALQSEGQTFQTGYSDNLLRCDICDVVVNSTHQLQTHLTGTKHRRKSMKRSAQDASEDLTPPGVPAKKKPTEFNQMGFQAEPPIGIRQITNSTFTKSGKFYCETCKISLNSEIQLHQHANSKKHLDRVMGNQNTSKPWCPGKNSNFAVKNPQSLKPSESVPTQAVVKGTSSLHDSFIQGETMT